jgi:hypothetical protein
VWWSARLVSRALIKSDCICIRQMNRERSWSFLVFLYRRYNRSLWNDIMFQWRLLSAFVGECCNHVSNVLQSNAFVCCGGKSAGEFAVGIVLVPNNRYAYDQS